MDGWWKMASSRMSDKLRMGTASTDEINAAFDKVYPELLNLAHYYAGMVHVPFVNVEQMIRNEMQTPEFKKQAVQIIADAITAAEAVHTPSAGGSGGASADATVIPAGAGAKK